jgi:hypothetical protein
VLEQDIELVISMNATINNDFENITNTWKNIFANFIELIIHDTDNIYEEHIFKILRKSNACSTVWTKIFIENFQAHLTYQYDGPTYPELFMSVVFTNFNDLEFMTTQLETITQYLKYLCVEAKLGENYYNDLDDNTDIMENDDKMLFCRLSLICTAIQFANLHKSFIQDVIENNLTPATCLK